MKTYKDIQYGNPNIERHKLDVYLPETELTAIYIHFHGGGIEAGDKNDQQFLSKLTEHGIGVVIPNYRLYPSAKFPQFINDAAQAVKWTYDNYNHNIFIGGSSAGAYISMMLAFDQKFLHEYEIDSDSITGYIFDAGQTTVHFNVLREYGIDTRRVIVDEKAPLYHITADRNYPPMFVLCADNDIKNRYEQNLLLMSTLNHFECDGKVKFKLMEGYGHCGYTSQPIFCELIVDFITKTLGTD